MLDNDAKRKLVSRAAELTQAARAASERDRDYYDHHQLTEQEENTLRRRGQPIIINNRIQRKVDAMVGLEQKGRVDPQAWPRNPQDQDAADVATKALVYVEECERFDVKRSSAFENLLIEGYGGVEVCAKRDRYGMTPCLTRLRWEEIFFDPNSREKDFSDASYMGVQKWMSEDSAVEYCRPFWQGDADELRALFDTQSTFSDETYDDRPREEGQMAWVDPKMRRVRVVQMYYQRGGEWRLAIFTGRGDIYDEASPYLDEEGRPACAMVLMTAYVDRENRRYGLVRSLISLQDEVNKRRSKSLHLLNSRQTVALKGAVDPGLLKRELAKADGHIPIDESVLPPGATSIRDAFDLIPTTDQVAGHAQLLTEAKQEIDMLGPNASLMGQLEGQHSGRAIMAQQQAGLAELAPIYDSLRDWTERVYRKIWAGIRQFWTEPRWVRVTDEQDAPQFIGLNQVVAGPMGLQQVNSPAQMDMDIIVGMTPEFVTLRHEQFDRIAEFAQANPGVIPPHVLLEMADIPDKKRIREMMEPDPQTAQMQQVQQQLAARGAEAEVAGLEAKAMRDQAAAQKDMAAIAGEQAKAQAEAIRAQAEGQKLALAASQAEVERAKVPLAYAQARTESAKVPFEARKVAVAEFDAETRRMVAEKPAPRPAAAR